MSDSFLTKLNNTNLKELRSLVAYEHFPNRGYIISKKTKKKLNELTIEERIQSIIDKQEPLTKSQIVWRGQVDNKEIIPRSWFSTSTYRHIAEEIYSAKEYLFKIHLQPGIKCIDLYKLYKKYGINNPYNAPINNVRKLLENNEHIINPYNNYKDFGEIIVNGGGKFWKDDKKQEEGFKLLEHIHKEDYLSVIDYYIYETYYFPDTSTMSPKNVTIKRKRPQVAPAPNTGPKNVTPKNITIKRKRPKVAPNKK